MHVVGTVSGEARWARASSVNIRARWRRFMMRYIVHARVEAGWPRNGLPRVITERVWPGRARAISRA